MRLDSEILADIQKLERKQIRAVAELLMNPADAEARKHFEQRQAQIAELRAQLSTRRA